MTLALPILHDVPIRPAYAAGPRDLAAVRLLRLSITDRCNLRCVYCMPDDGVTFYDRADLLSVDDILAVAAAARNVGVDHFKLTGGEPTVRSDLIQIVRGLRALGPADLSLTTNGLLLDRLAAPLRDAGLDRVTVSLDALDPAVFKTISGGRPYGVEQVLAGLDALERAGFTATKINTVVVGGVNDHEVVALAALTLERPWTVRFIEYMPLGDSKLLAAGLDAAQLRIVSTEDTRERIEAALGPLQQVMRGDEPGVGPAEVYRLGGAAGRIGFISAMSRPFCETCNRLRLTARGELRACLFDGGEVGLMPELRRPGGPRNDRLIRLMTQCVQEKPDTHSPRGNRAMSQLGG